MIFKDTELKDAYIIELERLSDDRGFFSRSYCANEFREHGIKHHILQSNVSYNKAKGTLRGLHYQEKPYEEAKLIRCTKGAVYDVIIDIRPGSISYKNWTGAELNEQNHRMLYVPKGFAHGFITLEDKTEVTYQMSEIYTPGVDKGIRWDDPAFAIEWPVTVSKISEKDQNWTDFKPV
jgi:dTDP-4-dehydrorhamnose 3,5-epimerase